MESPISMSFPAEPRNDDIAIWLLSFRSGLSIFS